MDNFCFIYILQLQYLRGFDISTIFSFFRYLIYINFEFIDVKCAAEASKKLKTSFTNVSDNLISRPSLGLAFPFSQDMS